MTLSILQRVGPLGSALVLLLFIATGCQEAADSPNDAPPTASTASFGADVKPGAAVPVADVARQPARYDGQTLTVEGRIARVCQKKGCWIALDAGGARPVRVLVPRTDSGYVFTLPVDASGTALVHGRVALKPLAPATRDHYAADGGPRPDSVEVQIAADGVRLATAGP